jgi:hypothetical protein
VSLVPAYYNGAVYTLIVPSGNSSNPNQFLVLCFPPQGPNFNNHSHAPANTFYEILLPGATQYACPDGSLRHDHVMTFVPGVPGYRPLWNPTLFLPGPAFDVSIMPLTSEAAVKAAAAANQVIIIPTSDVLHQPVIIATVTH